ncbi:MAG: DNA recombination protein RmuC [Actinobacteria bacterium]|nr:DNA recombination protein RmuC [Actinomycetota bacterium]
MSDQAALAAVIAGLVGGLIGLVLGYRMSPSRSSSDADPAVTAAEEYVGHSLSTLAQRVDALTATQASGQAQLSEQLRGIADASDVLREHTGRLAQSLSHTGFRGRWGEMQLRRIVEVAGLTRGVDFTEQLSITDIETTLRPDMVITLSDRRRIVIDAKVPMDALIRADQQRTQDAHSEGEVINESVATAHSKAVGAHIDKLASKQYWRQFDESPEFVVMFLPAESLLSLALQTDPALLERAFRRNVVLATPTTLLALLRTIALSWRDQDVAENAAAIHQAAQELLDRLVKMTSHLAKLGSNLDAATDSYNKFIGSYDSRVMVSARRMADLGIATTLPDSPTILERSTRPTPGVAASTSAAD